MYVDPVHGCRHHTDMGCVADVWGKLPSSSGSRWVGCVSG